MGQRMLDLLSLSAYQVQPSIIPLVTFLLVRTSIKYGIDTSSCSAFGGFGAILILMQKFDRARDMAKAMELMLDDPDMIKVQSKVIFVSETYIYHWTSPIQGTLSPLLSGYQRGLEVGDVETAGKYALSGELWYFQQLHFSIPS